MAGVELVHQVLDRLLGLFLLFFEPAFFGGSALAFLFALLGELGLVNALFFESLVDDDADDDHRDDENCSGHTSEQLIGKLLFDAFLGFLDAARFFDAGVGFDLGAALRFVDAELFFARESLFLLALLSSLVFRGANLCFFLFALAPLFILDGASGRLFLGADRRCLFCEPLLLQVFQLVEREKKRVFATIRHTKISYTGPDNSPVLSIIVQMRRASVRVGNGFLAVLALCGSLLFCLDAAFASAGPAVVETPAAPSDAPDSSEPQSGQVVSQVRIGGTLLSGDTADKLLRFLDMRLPAHWDEELRTRVRRDLDVLGYQASYSMTQGSTLTIAVRPMRVVRRLYVTGNWPIFEWEILSFVTWRAGYRLPEGDALVTEMRRQERELVSFLQRTGYYDATVNFMLDWAPDHPEQVSVRIVVNLNVGLWRLRYRIGNVHSEGIKLLSPPELHGFFEHCCLWFGRTSTERINEDIKRLVDHYQNKGFAGVRIARREIRPNPKERVVDLDLAIEERKRVELYFLGRHELSQSDLRSAVTIFRDNYYSANELDESARNIHRLYQQRGFFEARVKWRWRNRSGDPVEVEFLIHEGPQLKVRDIEFAPGPSGKPLSYGVGKLEEQVRTRRYPRLGMLGLGEGGFASAVALSQDVAHLEEFYRREGYPKARVSVHMARSRESLGKFALLGLQAALDEDGQSGDLFLRFEIDEGPRQEVDSVAVEFVGDHTVSETQIVKGLLLRAGKPYTPDALIADKLRLLEQLAALGHPYAVIDPTQSRWNADHTKVTLRWLITENEPVRFGPILIRGNFVTRESIIRRDLLFKEGDLFDRNKLLEAEQNLIGRQVFASVRVVPNPGETDEFRAEAHEKGWQLRRNPVPVLIEVTERYDNSGELGIYVGVSTDNPLYSSANYMWRNVLGTGSEVELRGELGIRVQSLLARVAAPRLWNPFVRLDVRGFWRNENTYSIGQVTSYGANAELTRFFARADEQGRRLPPTLRVFGRLEFNISQILVPLYRGEGSTDVNLDGDRSQSLKFSAGIVWDRRVGFEAPALLMRNLPVPTNPLMPVSGFLLSAQATAALCCSLSQPNVSGSFIALSGQAVWLRPFGPALRSEDGWPFGMKRFNWKMNLRVNYGFPLTRPALPVVERYYAGGDSSTRGYDADALRAEEVRAPIGPLTGEPAYRIVPVGGNVRILSQLEWEFAITPKIGGWPWVGALFLDTGAVSDGFSRLKWNDVRFSVGISLVRLLTQFGALSLDYAYPLVMPGQESLVQSDRWKREAWYAHFPGRIHFNWGMPISL